FNGTAPKFFLGKCNNSWKRSPTPFLGYFYIRAISHRHLFLAGKGLPAYYVGVLLLNLPPTGWTCNGHLHTQAAFCNLPHILVHLVDHRKLAYQEGTADPGPLFGRRIV